MNLVQINERLKDLPMQVIQQYANGMNPEVPPYLALGELQRREIAQKQMATAQGGMQGPQPSIKEQVEQRAGLMAAQGLQQQQQMQQMAQPRGPMPAAEGIPQPEAQPEMMASGGLASVPVRRDMFDYAGGGIVAFAGGGSPTREQLEAQRNSDAKTLKKIRDTLGDAAGDAAAKMLAAGADIASIIPRALAGAADTAIVRPARAMGADIGYLSPELTPGDQGSDTATPFYDRYIRAKETPTDSRQQAPTPPASVSEARATAMAGPQAQAPTGLPAALQGSVRPPLPPTTRPVAATPAAPAPAPAPQAGLPAAAQSNATPYMKKLEDMIATAPVAPTEEGAIASMNKLTPAAMQEAAMQKRIEDQRARAEQERAAYEKSRPSGLDELINMLGQAGRSKGLSGMAPAYTAIEQQKRAQDLAMEKRQNELLTAIEGRDYEGAKEVFGARTKAFDTAKQLFGKEKESAIKAAGDLAQVDQSRINNELKILSEEKLKRLELASRAADRAQQGAGLALKTDYLAKMAKSRLLAEQGDAAGSAKLAAEAADILTVSGGLGTSGVGAENAQTRMLRDARKDIDDRLETMTGKEPEYAELVKQRREISKRIIDRALKESGGAGADAKSGVVDKSNPLLK